MSAEKSRLRISYSPHGGFRIVCDKRSLMMDSHFTCMGCLDLDCYVKKNLKELMKESAFRRCCDNCGAGIDWGYFLIIRQLIKAGLISEDFRHLCCYCYLENLRKRRRGFRTIFDQQGGREC